ncbi:MAG: hypothetical protein IPN49_12765 [Saprospiraceae bacterium]|nr:hypothetical protein [Saprospiraceae bacterium]
MINGETVNLSNWPSPEIYVSRLVSKSSKMHGIRLPYNFNAPLTGYHFIGYKLGDINNSYFESNLQTIPVDVIDEIITAGETYTTAVYSNDDINANGIQFKIPKTVKLEIKEVKAVF